MSSRSLAAARSRRAGENAPPVSGNRPVTSIGSYAAFGQQSPNPPQNVRVARGQQPPQQNSYQQQPPQQNSYQQPPLTQPPSNQNGLPFTKLSISDAIGLITIRLGRVEQWIIETDHENEQNDHSSNLPDNSRVVDNSILTNFASRLDSLEKKENVPANTSEEITKLVEDVGKMNQHLTKIVEESSKHSLTTAKHTEQLFRFERELVETKDILKTFMLKYDQFTSETTDKFGDFEYVISELEKNVQPNEEVNNTIDIYNNNDNNSNDNDNNYDDNDNTYNDNTYNDNDNDNNYDESYNNDESDNNDTDIVTKNSDSKMSSIMSVDLKNLIKQELSTST